jgi:hypothetical protein
MAHNPDSNLQKMAKTCNSRSTKKQVLWDQDEDQRPFIACLSNKLSSNQIK